MSYLPEWLSRLVTPESYGESVVNQIYGGNGSAAITPDPSYDVNDLSSPNVYVAAKGAVKETLSTVGGGLEKWLYIIIGVVLLAVVVNAAVPALLRR
jgi:hypothetical protein